MSPFNLEKNIRSKMQNRELEPSSSAWERLEQQLDAEENKTSKNYSLIFAVAAVLIIALISVVFLKTHSIETPQIGTEIPLEEVKPKEKQNFDSSMPTEIVFEEPDKKVSDEVIKSEIRTSDSESYSEDAVGIVSATTREKDQGISEEKENIVKDDFFEQKVMDVATTIRNRFESDENIDLDEVELLLENARREIYQERLLKNSQTDATALLNEVEWELDKNFYDKVFYALGESFKKIATAYSERNRY